MIDERIPGAPLVVNITGAPGSGKTEVIKSIRATLGVHALFVPEVATMVPNDLHNRSVAELERDLTFQDCIWHMQHYEEAVALHHARVTGHQFVICDRGVVDGAAYVPMTRSEFFHGRHGKTLEQVFGRYDVVIFLETTAVGLPHLYRQTVYRGESLEEAAALHSRTFKAYKGHPNLHEVSCSADGIQGKVDAVLRIIHEQAARFAA